MNKILLFLILESSFIIQARAQDADGPDIHGSLEVQGILNSKDHVPFWMRSDRYGSIPLAGASAALLGAIRKDYDSTGDNWLDWGGSLEFRADAGAASRLSLIEGYGKIRASIFELRAGRSKMFMGLVDSTLSSGAFAVSGNAPGIPQVQLSIPAYWTLPFFGGIFAVKGSFSHGWIGKLKVLDSFQVKHVETFFHQSSFYVRLGLPDWRVRLYGGFNHQVFWGNEKTILGDQYKLSPLKSFEYVALGKTYLGSKVGNHLGSIDLAMEYEFDNMLLTVYRQNFYDEGALIHLANLRDGLNGLSLQNKNADEGGFQWNKLVLEVFCSKDQAGYPNSRRTPSGDENYYNNYQYADGWSYKGLGLGSPFITPYTSTRSDLPNDTVDYFNNNRVIALYAGLEGAVEDIHFTTRLSYSFNYGTFATSPWGHSTGNTFYPPKYGIFKEVRQLSAYVEVTKPLSDGLELGCAAALDSGKLFNDSGGFILKLRKSL